MIFRGMQKLTLLDYPGKVACTLFTGGCDFCCPFCHNAGLVKRAATLPIYSEETVLAHLRSRKGILDGVCVTGGEPLLHFEGLLGFLPRVKELGYLVKLDTNGNHPEELRALLEAGLADRVAMDIKNAHFLYAKTAGVRELDINRIEESIEIIRAMAPDHEFRTTVVRGLHTPGSMEALAQWLQGEDEYYIQAYKDSGDVIDPLSEGFSAEELERFLTVVRPYLPNAKLRGVD